MNNKAGEMEYHEADRSTTAHGVGFTTYFNPFSFHVLNRG